MSVIATFLSRGEYVSGGEVPRGDGVSQSFHILDNDVVRAADDTQTLALDHTGGALADESLAGGNGDTKNTSLVTWGISVACLSVGIVSESDQIREIANLLGDGADGRGVWLIVLAPVVLVDGDLTLGVGAPGRASTALSSSLSAAEVKSLGQNNDTGLAVAQVRDQLGSSLGIDRARRATAGHTLGETLSSAGDTDGSGLRSEGCDQGSEFHDDNQVSRKKKGKER